MVPDRVGVSVDEGRDIRIPTDLIERDEIANEDAFELHAVLATLRLARVMQDPFLISKVRHGRSRDPTSQLQSRPAITMC